MDSESLARLSTGTQLSHLEDRVFEGEVPKKPFLLHRSTWKSKPDTVKLTLKLDRSWYESSAAENEVEEAMCQD